MLKLGPPIQNNMVLQQNCHIPIWGRAKPGDEISVEFQGRCQEAEADKDGRWIVRFDPLIAGGPFNMLVEGNTETIKLDNILVGEVWLCAGQSNMNRPLKISKDSKADIEAANYPRMRLLRVWPQEPQETAEEFREGSVWKPCMPFSAEAFSAAGYYFGKELADRYDFPIGLIHLANGGRSICCFMPEAAGRNYAERANIRRIAKDMSPWDPGGMYRGMIQPLMPYAFRGMLWYQGEADVKASYVYEKELFPLFQSFMTTAFGFGPQWPFHILSVEIAPFGEAPGPRLVNDPQVRFRSMQWRLAQKYSDMHVVSLIDHGFNEIHPEDKRPVGYRLAMKARAEVYGDDCQHAGPKPIAMQQAGSALVIQFTNVGGGLVLDEAKADMMFEIGTSEEWNDMRRHRVSVRVMDKNKIRLRHGSMDLPVIARYAWVAWPNACLFNSDGWPCPPFSLRLP